MSADDSDPTDTGALFAQVPAPPTHEVRSAIDGCIAHPDPDVRKFGETFALWFNSETVQRGARIVKAKESLAASQRDSVRYLATQDARWERIEKHLVEDVDDEPTAVVKGLGKVKVLAAALWSNPQALVVLVGLLLGALQVLGMYLDDGEVDADEARAILLEAAKTGGVEEPEVQPDAVDPEQP